MASCKSLIFILALFGTLVLSHQYRLRRASPTELQDKQAVVVSAVNDYNPEDGSFIYGFEQDNGVAVNAKGYLRDGKQVIEGSYTLQSEDGHPLKIQYVADENGFYPTGEAIPTPHPAIVKALEYLRSLPPQPEDNKA